MQRINSVPIDQYMNHDLMPDNQYNNRFMMNQDENKFGYAFSIMIKI